MELRQIPQESDSEKSDDESDDDTEAEETEDKELTEQQTLRPDEEVDAVHNRDKLKEEIMDETMNRFHEIFMSSGFMQTMVDLVKKKMMVDDQPRSKLDLQGDKYTKGKLKEKSANSKKRG